MNDPKLWLLVVMGGLGVWFVSYWWRRLVGEWPWHPAIGALTNFFDTLGIGSFATTTSLYKPKALVADEKIPGTLNVGHTLPTLVQAFIYIVAVAVDPITLVLMIAAAVLGSWLGAGVVSRWPRRQIQIGMGLALLAAGTLMFMSAMRWASAGGDALALSGVKLALGLAGNFALGALMTLGIGMYAPCMILIGLLGMNAATAFPIMMGSCAFLMPVGSLRFIRENAYSVPNALGLAIGGLPAVFVAALLVVSMNLNTVRWLVIGVVLYTAITMLVAAGREKPEPVPPRA